jgi:DNA invertase Pin-like site-specific DNA recombinase
MNAKRIRFRSLTQPLIDTTTPHGELIFKLFAILAEHERKRLIQRTRAGLTAARARGRMGGRPKGLSNRYQSIAPMIASAHGEGRSIRDIMQAFQILSTATVYKILATFKPIQSTP